MSPKYKQFIFESYKFNIDSKALELNYSFDGKLKFSERFHFDFDFTDFDEKVLDRACQMLFLMAGVSYYKAYLAPEIVLNNFEIDETAAGFFSKTYQKGLGEFFYVNRLDPTTEIKFPHNPEADLPILNTLAGKGLLVGIGGGKDSLVSVELLRDHVDDLTSWSLNHRPQLTPLIERIGLKHYWVEREWDKSLLELNNADALNGHIPISAIIACVGTVVAILTDHKDMVVSNEQSANEPTLHIGDVAINHQYSKSQEFEQDYQSLLIHNFGATQCYYSFLRPLSELYIAELFSTSGYERYKDVFSSCNRAFVHTSDKIFWDGTCSKCAFFFLAMTSFIERSKLEQLFSAKNLLLTENLEPVYRQLLGIAGDKPLDCVGEIEECRAAMLLAQKRYPELSSKYEFESPTDYDYKKMHSHHMPDEIYKLLQDGINQLKIGQ